MGNVFIIGNGFDLDLGLPTKYSDFAKSKYWPAAPERKKTDGEQPKKDSGIVYYSVISDSSKLEEAIENARSREMWFDLEKELLDYSMQYEPKTPDFTRFSRESPNEVKSNVDYFNKLRDSLNDYILEVQKNQDIIEDCTARDVLKAIVDNGYFESVYSFNYTDLNSIARRIGIAQGINYTHLHGNVLDNSIILGVDETKLRDGYESFHKSSSRYYRSHSLHNALVEADEIVVFGLSFGSIDYSYFNRFFKQISEEESVTNGKKQYITIFTKNDSSRLSIITSLRNMGIDIQRLYAQSHFQIICTSDDGEKQELADFYLRLRQNSKEVFDENLSYIAGIVH
mgnify:CR=1 FL=1